MNNILKFAATAVQESAGIFDSAPLESVALSAGGFVNSCADWVSENKEIVIGVGAAVALGVGVYYGYPWARDRIKARTLDKGTKNAAKSAPDMPAATRTAEEVEAALAKAVQDFEEFKAQQAAA